VKKNVVPLHGQGTHKMKTDISGMIKTAALATAILCCLPLAVFAQAEDPIVEAEADSTVSRKRSLNGYPYVYYTPETELAVGAGGIMIFYTSDEPNLSPSKVTLSAYYSTNGSYKAALTPVIYMNEDKVYATMPVSAGHFVDKFWGIGNQTPDTGSENYIRDEFAASLTVQLPPVWFSADRAGFIFDYADTQIDDETDNSFLVNDEVVGSSGGQLIGIGTDLVWDTRDHKFFPNTGAYQYFKLVVYPEIGDFIFYNLELDVRHYHAFAPNHVLAGNLYFATAVGEVPFYKLPALGGQNRMRGYFYGRYRDNVYSVLQIEYRQFVSRKFGFVTFAGIGDVAPNLLKFRIDEIKLSGGVGLRYLFNAEQKVNLRVDLGIGEDGNTGIYFGLEEAF
jgi:outer membrane protein assembly factor BamA